MANTLPQSNPVGWFELHVSDLERAKTFYRAVFKRPMEDLPAPAGGELQMCGFTMNPGGTGAAGALVKGPNLSPGSGGTLVYFSSPDCAIEAARAAAHGGKVLQQKMSIGPYGFVAIVQDTEGNSIGVHSRE